MSPSALDIVIPVVAVLVTVVVLTFVLRSLFASTGTIKNGIAGSAVIQRIADTGTTISAPNIGAEAPVYKLGLLVSPSDGVGSYLAESKQAVPRMFVPFVVPGAQVPVDIDSGQRDRVKVSWKRYGESGVSLPGSASSAGFRQLADGTFMMPVVNGVPQGGGEVVQAVRSGHMPTHVGSAAQLLATGIRCTAVVITAMPFGKTAGELMPSVDPVHASDPMWFFTVSVEMPGRAPFPAVFGHRVPRHRVADVAPGLRLSVAVSRDNPSNEVAIAW